jgi:hypothetical protein
MKNIHLLKTDKPSRLFKFANQFHLDTIPKDYYKKYNIYITSDEEIKEGDYYLSWQDYFSPPKFVVYVKSSGVNGDGKKIILTTDQDLIANGVQGIDDNFLEWFVKNPSYEFVKVRKRFSEFTVEPFVGYEIIIPQEESKQETTGKEFYESADKVITVERQETLEEAAENFANSKEWINGGASNWVQFSFKKGAKWQAERMYSEEEVKRILMKTGNYTKISLDAWFGQFKKK